MKAYNLVADSNFFYRLRGFAIISVAYAHSLSLRSYLLSSIARLLAVIGVPLFLICSGYFFRRTDESIRLIASKKFQTIVLPWLVWGSVAFSLEYVRGVYDFSFLVYVKFLFGYGTWLYYVPVYLFIYFLYSIIKSDKLDVIAIWMFLCSNSLTWFTNLSILGDFFTRYQNPMNFIGYFAIGHLIRRYSILDKAIPQLAIWGGEYLLPFMV